MDTFDEALAETLNGIFVLRADRLELMAKTLHDSTIDTLECSWMANTFEGSMVGAFDESRTTDMLDNSEMDVSINKTGCTRMSPVPSWTQSAGHRPNAASRISRRRCHQRRTADNEQATHQVTGSNGGGPRQNLLNRTPFPARRCTSKHTKQRKATNTAASTSATCRLKWGKKTH